LIETLTKLVLVDGVINENKTLTGDENSLVEAHRKSVKMLDLRAFFMIWAVEPPRMLK
jgi:hypothetical protein